MNAEDKRAEQAVRHRIVDAYLELLREKETSEISVTEISERAGVSRMTFYRKFKDKREAVDFYLGGIMHWEVAWDQEKNVEGSIWDLEYGIRFFRVMEKYRETILLLVERGYATLLLRVINLTNECNAGDMPQCSIDRYNLYFLAGAGFNSMLIWLQDGCRETPEEMARALRDHIRIGS